MTKRPRPPPRSTPSSGAGEPDLPSLVELERFTAASMREWKDVATRLGALHRILYFELESLRQRDESRLIDAVRVASSSSFVVDSWSRVVDYRYSLEPLSVDGSLKSIGGRFNIGAELSPGAFTAFPALYLAENYPTAFQERFGSLPGMHSSGLTGEELALRKVDSFTQVRVRGFLENVLDVGDLSALKPIADIIKEFPLPKAVPATVRRLKISRTPWLIRSPLTLQRQLLHPAWRMLPMQFDLPSNSQIFGRLASAAGVHGILFPSARSPRHQCLALYPQNWAGSTSYVEVADGAPNAARLVRIDGTSEYRYDR